jgi:hypothetical protein
MQGYEFWLFETHAFAKCSFSKSTRSVTELLFSDIEIYRHHILYIRHQHYRCICFPEVDQGTLSFLLFAGLQVDPNLLECPRLWQPTSTLRCTRYQNSMAHNYDVGTKAWQPDTTEGWVASEVVSKTEADGKIMLVFDLANGEVQIMTNSSSSTCTNIH